METHGTGGYSNKHIKLVTSKGRVLQTASFNSKVGDYLLYVSGTNTARLDSLQHPCWFRYHFPTKCWWILVLYLEYLRLTLFTVRNEVAKVMFLHLCVCPQGGSASVHTGYPPPPKQVPSPESRYPPEQVPPPPGSRRLLLRTVRIPTGIHSI